eukprot:5473961-Pyramimonas_sp.AAC.2
MRQQGRVLPRLRSDGGGARRMIRRLVPHETETSGEDLVQALVGHVVVGQKVPGLVLVVVREGRMVPIEVVHEAEVVVAFRAFPLLLEDARVALSLPHGKSPQGPGGGLRQR